MKSLFWSSVFVFLFVTASVFARSVGAQIRQPEPFVQWADLIERKSSTVFIGSRQSDESWVRGQCEAFSEKFSNWLKLELIKRTDLDPSRINHRMITMQEPLLGYLGCRLEVVGWRQTPPMAKFRATPRIRKITRETSDACAGKQAELEKQMGEENSNILALVRDDSRGNALGAADCRILTLEAISNE
jgi:hypothetical protein